MAVAIAVGRPGIDALLVASQVVLSIVLPFITLPLLYLTSFKKYMTVKIRDAAVAGSATPSDSTSLEDKERQPATLGVGETEIDYSNGKVMTTIGISIWLVVVAANFYVIISLATHKEG